MGVSLKSLAKAAGVDPATVYRAARGDGDNRGRTLSKLGEALEAEEIRIARHLLALPHVRAALAAAPQSEAA